MTDMRWSPMVTEKKIALYSVQMAGSHHNDLPETKPYTYRGLGYDINDPTDPKHPAYERPKAKARVNKTAFIPAPGGASALALTERNAARKKADAERAAAKRVRAR